MFHTFPCPNQPHVLAPMNHYEIKAPIIFKDRFRIGPKKNRRPPKIANICKYTPSSNSDFWVENIRLKRINHPFLGKKPWISPITWEISGSPAAFQVPPVVGPSWEFRISTAAAQSQRSDPGRRLSRG